MTITRKHTQKEEDTERRNIAEIRSLESLRKNRIIVVGALIGGMIPAKPPAKLASSLISRAVSEAIKEDKTFAARK